MEDKWLICIYGVGYYKSSTFSDIKSKGIEKIYPHLTPNPNNAKKYETYDNALEDLEELKIKCALPEFKIKRLSECLKESERIFGKLPSSN